MTNHSIVFFNTQFQRQVCEGSFNLNPFEQLALPFLHGQVLDVGCGLGNLTIEAARQGCTLVALDASIAGIEHIQSVAQAENLAIKAQQVNLSTYEISGSYNVIIAIGLLMFLEKAKADKLLKDIMAHVVPGGYAIINVLIEGTTYLDMFEPNQYYLFGHSELQDKFAEWELIESRYDTFEAVGPSLKVFTTVVARKL